MQSPKCGNLNEPLHKAGALELMTGMLSRAARAPPETPEAGCGVTRGRQIAVVGKGEPDEALAPLAEEVGRRLAEADAIVVCGGRGGVMEAAARGGSRGGRRR